MIPALPIPFVLVEHIVQVKELTRADILALAAAIYEPQPRLWTRRGWQCPQCKKVNRKKHKQCACGITRDGLPEFCEREYAVQVA